MKNSFVFFPLLTYLSACTYHCAADITVLKELKVFPNPVDDVWIIQYNSCNAVVVKLINLNGVEVLNSTLPCGNNSHKINLQHLPSGNYIYNIRFCTNDSIFNKLIVQH
jgi:hypothetical protein